jgi:hypothetical protein
MKTRTAAEQHIRSLFHYQPFDAVRLARIFTENTLYCSNPTDFNDPWDCRPFFSKAILNDAPSYDRIAHWFTQVERKHNHTLPEAEHLRREHILRTDRQFLEARIDELTVGMKEAIEKQYRVFCLSLHADSALMWAHYAQSHRGICLEFSVQNPIFCGALPVEYTTGYPEFDLADDGGDASIHALLTKSQDWSYENEFRLIVAAPGYDSPGLHPTTGNFLTLPMGVLRSVTVGCLMASEDRALVRALVKGTAAPVELLIAHRTADRYALEIRKDG